MLAFAALWTLFEWWRGWMFTGVPWLALGYSQVDSPLGGFAPVVGVYGVSLITAACSALLGVMICEPGRARVAAPMALVFVFGLGHFLKQAEWTSPVGLPVKVSLLQGNISQDLKFQANLFNAFNRVVLGSSGSLPFIVNYAPTSLSAAALTNSNTAFGILTTQQNGPRRIQFALKLEF